MDSVEAGGATALTAADIDIEEVNAGFIGSSGEVGDGGAFFCTGGVSGGRDRCSEGKGWFRLAARGRAEGNRALLNFGCCCVGVDAGGAGVGVGGSAFGETGWEVVVTLFRSD